MEEYEEYNSDEIFVEIGEDNNEENISEFESKLLLFSDIWLWV